MKYLVFMFFFVFFGLIFFVFYKKERDVFHPICFFSLMQFINYAPSLLYKNTEHYGTFSDDNLLFLLICEAVFSIFVCAGFIFCDFVWKHFFYSKRTLSSPCRRNVPLIIIISIFMVGFLAKVYVIHSLGGIVYVITHSSESYSAQSSGFGYISLLYKFMVISILAMFERIKDGQSKKMNVIILVSMVVLYMGSYLIYSSRGAAFEIVLILIFCKHYCFKKFTLKSIFNLKFLLIVLFFIGVSYGALYIRDFSNPSKNASTSLLTIVESFFSELSRLGRDIFTYSYFSSHEKWGGLSYLNLLTSFAPSSVFQWKPPVDDGLYLVNLANGYLVGPNDSLSSMTIRAGSIPFTSQGLLFANFGIFGLIFGGILLGAIYWFSYFMVCNKRTPFYSCFYFYMVYMFGITTLLIFNVFQILVFMVLGELLFYKPRKSSSLSSFDSLRSN